MRPHRLELSAFGAYPGHEVIDFDLLADEGLFLIHGPTGAGKTTLLDAMCFALYGEVPGDAGKDRLVSDFAEPGSVPEVTFEFSTSTDRHRVTRAPEHTRPKQRGEGTTTASARVSLERLVDGSWVHVADRITEVRAEVERVIGLSAAQFQQVILLPQGKFERVLRAGSEQREQLLETLFDTSLYHHMTRWLDEQSRVAFAAVQSADQHLAELRAQAAAAWQGLDPEAAGADDQAALDAFADGSGRLLSEAEAMVAVATAELDTALAQQLQVEELAGRWARRNAALADQAVLDTHAADASADSAALVVADAAEVLRASLDAVASAGTELAAASASLAEVEARVGGAVVAAPSLPDAAADFATTDDDARLEAAASAVAGHRSRLAELSEDRRRAAAHSGSARAEIAAAEAKELEFVASEDARVASVERLAVLRAELGAARAVVDRLGDLEQRSRDAEASLQSCVELAAARVEHAATLAAHIAAIDRAQVARDTAQDLRSRYLDGIAAALAADLVDDAACPVCGSAEHPAPATAAADAVDRAEVDAAEVSATVRASEREAADGAHRVAESRVAVLEALVAGLEEPQARTEAAVALDAWQQAVTTAGLVRALEAEVDEVERAIAVSTSRREAAQLAAVTHRAGADAAHAAAEVLIAGVGEVLGDGVDLDAAVAGVAAVAETLSSLRTARGALATQRSLHEQVSTRLTEELARSPFADPSAASVALLAPGALTALRERVTTDQEARARIAMTLASEDLQSLPDEPPDTASAAARSTSARAVHTSAVEVAAARRQISADLVRLADEHRLGDADLSGLRARAAELASVSNRCAGKSRPKISIQRWVLATYLDEICTYANHRLGGMTSGRFSLFVDRRDTQGAGQVGLGLRVLDAHSGADRDVSTMSGGETFQASLALAVGVADTVAAHAGGVQLGALFVDEGFGTLDPEALQLAMDELDRLREGGRMVGVISHVAALRERIGYGIAVTRSDSGSTLRVCEIEPV